MCRRDRLNKSGRSSAPTPFSPTNLVHPPSTWSTGSRVPFQRNEPTGGPEGSGDTRYQEVKVNYWTNLFRRCVETYRRGMDEIKKFLKLDNIQFKNLH